MPTLTPTLWDEFTNGDRRACARLITLVENHPDAIPDVHHQLAPKLGKAIRIGITGPPGVGKSTLNALLALGLADRGHRVGLIAVDPSSPFTGGAFMGDRVRMDRLVGDNRIFMRSLASREGTGGLSPATPYVADVLEGFGMDRILIETVGVGQAELDVMACADIVVLVLQPSTGDSIQSLKAGIIEAADIIVVNKADIPGVELALQALRFALGLGKGRKDRPVPPLMPTSAQQSEGIDKLLDEIEAQAKRLVDSGRHLEMRRARIAREIRSGIERCLWEKYAARADAESGIAHAAEDLARSGGSPYPFIGDACAKINITLDRKAETNDSQDR